MLSLSLTGVRSLLAVGAHPDDIEIAAGGLLLSLAAASPGRTGALRAAAPARRTGRPRRGPPRPRSCPAPSVTFALHDLPDGRLPAHWDAVKEILHEAAAGVAAPDLVICPAPNDAHQDHRLLGRAGADRRSATSSCCTTRSRSGTATWPGATSTCRCPTSVARRKVELLHASFPSQKARDWWDDEVFLGLARLRGMECRSRYAEAFDCTKAAVRFGVSRRVTPRATRRPRPAGAAARRSRCGTTGS